jgi:hypothetical protein
MVKRRDFMDSDRNWRSRMASKFCAASAVLSGLVVVDAASFATA